MPPSHQRSCISPASTSSCIGLAKLGGCVHAAGVAETALNSTENKDKRESPANSRTFILPPQILAFQWPYWYRKCSGKSSQHRLQPKGHRNPSDYCMQPYSVRPRNAPQAPCIKHSHLLTEIELFFSKGTWFLINNPLTREITVLPDLGISLTIIMGINGL